MLTGNRESKRMWNFLKADLVKVKEHWLAVTASVVAFVLAALDIFNFTIVSQDFMVQLVAAASLGISVAIASRISTKTERTYFAIAVCGLAVIVVFFIANNESPYFFERFLQLALITHLWIAIAPAIRNHFADEAETGRFNWFLLVRMSMVAV